MGGEDGLGLAGLGVGFEGDGGSGAPLGPGAGRGKAGLGGDWRAGGAWSGGAVGAHRRDELIIITAGKLNMRVWDLDLANRKAPPAPPPPVPSLRLRGRAWRRLVRDERCVSGRVGG